MADNSLEGHVGQNHEAGNDAPSGGKAKGASAETMSPPVLHLEAHHIEKMFKNKLPPIGSKIKFNAVAHVGAYSEGADGPPSGGKAKGGEGNTKRTMALHFHKMEIGHSAGGPGTDEQQSAERIKGAKAEMDKALSRRTGGSSVTEEGEEKGGSKEKPAGGKLGSKKSGG